MRPDRKQETDRWLRQAEHDLEIAELLLGHEHYADACFHCQQAAEKALKGLGYYWESYRAWGHRVADLLDLLIRHDPAFVEFRSDVGVLRQFYLGTRYPDVQPDMVPYEIYTEDQARDALARARRIVEHGRKTIEQGGEGTTGQESPGR